jgi:two-component system response regulator
MRSPYLLLVEDNRDDAALAVLALKKASVPSDVVVLHDGAEALDFLLGKGFHEGRDVHRLPDVVILDLRLPKVDGLEVLKKIRGEALTRLLPVVVFSSSGDESDVCGSYENGASSYVRKPADFEAFQRTVQAIGLYWLSVNERPPCSVAEGESRATPE